MVAPMLTGCGLLLLLAGCDGGSGPGGPGEVALRLEQVATGLDFPLFLTAPPGDQSRFFVVEKTGRIRVIKNGSLLPTPFLDLSAQVSGASEQGLLGLAFHPQYTTNGRFVVDYTNPSGDTRVSTFTVSSDPDVANSASELVLLAVPQPFNNHNGGMVVFGPDGDLYVGMGDGGSSGDPQGNAQNRGALLGKILRVGLSGARQLSVPSDNPFVGQAGARPEIWSYGLRNPWRFSFDRQTGDLYIADVGQDAREEIDVSTAASGSGRGLDYGWNITEGTACYSPSSGCNRTGLTPPVLDYDHSQGCSITGGYVYRGSALPALRGTYFYGDYCGGWVRSFRLQGSGVTGQQEWTSLATGGHLTSFGEDTQGELYVIIQEGTVFRIAAATP